MAFCDGGYTTNLPVEDLLEGKALVVWEYDGEPLAPERGGPARLLGGSAGFVEAASALLLQAGPPGDAIRTERFGANRNVVAQQGRQDAHEY